MNLIRKIKISKLTNIPLEGVDKEIVDFINSILNDLTPFKIDDEPLSTYYMNSKAEWVLEQDDKRGILGFRFDGFGEVLMSKLKYNEVQSIVKYMIEQSLKRTVSMPSMDRGVKYEWLEKVFKDYACNFNSGGRNKYVEKVFKEKRNELTQED